MRVSDFSIQASLSGDDTIRLNGVPVNVLRQISKALRESQDWLEVVDGIADVTIQFDPLTFTPSEALSRVQAFDIDLQENTAKTVGIQELSISFRTSDAPDLMNVCERLCLTKAELIEQLCQAGLYVDMMGFTPGFAYISGVPENLNVPRLDQPRVRVPAGSFGLAAGKCGAYALEGPGGWPIIGRVITPLFDPALTAPFLLASGLRLKLKPEV